MSDIKLDDVDRIEVKNSGPSKSDEEVIPEVAKAVYLGQYKTGVKRNKGPKKLVSVRVSEPEVHAVITVVREDIEGQSDLYHFDQNKVMTDGGLEIVRLGDDAFEVINHTYDDPQNHKYKVFAEDFEVHHCTCPAHEYYCTGFEFCKHMEAVDSVLSAGGKL